MSASINRGLPGGGLIIFEPLAQYAPLVCRINYYFGFSTEGFDPNSAWVNALDKVRRDLSPFAVIGDLDPLEECNIHRRTRTRRVIKPMIPDTAIKVRAPVLTRLVSIHGISHLDWFMGTYHARFLKEELARRFRLFCIGIEKPLPLGLADYAGMEPAWEIRHGREDGPPANMENLMEEDVHFIEHSRGKGKKPNPVPDTGPYWTTELHKLPPKRGQRPLLEAPWWAK